MQFLRMALRDSQLRRSRVRIVRVFLPWLWATAATVLALCLAPDTLRAQDAEQRHIQALVDLEKQINAATVEARYDDAERLAEQSVSQAIRTLGRNHLMVGAMLSTQASVFNEVGKYDQAERTAKQALSIIVAKLGPHDLVASEALTNLANAHWYMRRFAEAESEHRQALAIRERTKGAVSEEAAGALENLANTVEVMGRFLEAESLYQRALAVRVKVHGPNHARVAQTYYNLGVHYRWQDRHDEAEAHLQHARKLWERQLGNNHPHVASVLSNLAENARETARYADAEAYLKQADAIYRKQYGPTHRFVVANTALAELYFMQDRYDDAVAIYERALAYHEQNEGNDSYYAGNTHFDLARVRSNQEKFDQAEQHFQRALSIFRKHDAGAAEMHRLFLSRATMFIQLERYQDAILDLREALRYGEDVRTQFSGSDEDRAGSFAFYSEAFWLMAYCQALVGNAAEMFAASERGRSRSLMDQMNAGHLDLLSGVPIAETQLLKEALTRAEGRVAMLERQLQVLAAQENLAAAERDQRGMELLQQMESARRQLVDAHTAIRNASPAYRQSVRRSLQPVSLAETQRWAQGQKFLILYYGSSDIGSFVGSIGRVGDSAAVSLDITPSQAKILGIKLHDEQTMLTASQIDGAIQQLLPMLADPKLNDQATQRLATLWEVLVPPADRQALLEGKYEGLVVIPSGSLALLPFEALVVRSQPDVVYLLDEGPAIAYAPSATVLFNLLERASAKPSGDNRAAVLTVGDVAYGQTGEVASLTSQQAGIMRARYGALGGQLKPLPFTSWECDWVKKAFAGASIGVNELLRTRATEGNLRQSAPGKRVLHLACHGMTDSAYGNFFGALALTPGPRGNADSSDDGFLTLAEIYQLDLRGNELAILSACQTNYGPKQQGEGVWALTRGFLVAGSRRVVASNWVVDDEAAATLVNYFSQHLAAADKAAAEKATEEKTAGEKAAANAASATAYARGLHQAKQAVRKDARWRKPYFWATFVLVGPPA